MAKDFYETLGVKRGAPQKEIRSAFRKLAREFHPDVNAGDKDAEKRFKEINNAYEVLSDTEKRRKYDKYGDRWEYADQIEEMERNRASRFGGNGGGYQQFEFSNVDDLNDLGGLGGVFSQMFGRGAGARTMSRRGANVEHPVEVTLEEAYAGTSRTLQLSSQEACPTCGGSGQLAGAICHTCGGSGAVERPRRLEVKIPAGVTTGSKVRVAGEGQPGRGGGGQGDLLLVVSVRPHPRFERRGDDLLTDVDVPLSALALGGEVEVPTVTGKVMLKVPPETQNGRVFRLGGLGMPRLNKEGKGSMQVKVRARMPEQLTDEQRRLFEELSATGA